MAPSSRLKQWAMTLVCMAVAAAFIGLGIFARNTVLKANPCEMTYSMREKTEVALCGKNCEYKMWKITNSNTRTLNPQPVLYVPGHLGSASQARSLASSMHDGSSYFQYFALDFAEGYSAFHGSDVFAQAHAVNLAIEKIVGMYAKKKSNAIDLSPEGTRKVMLVGHSVGGIVARAAVLLSSHPACAVRDIVQLSAPNARPSYSPDASLETAYALINRAWAGVYRNSSALPELCTALSLSSSGPNASAVPSLVCPACIASMRLVSITGGEVDLEVPPDLSDLNRLFPAPAMPRTLLPAPSGQPSSGLFAVVKGAINGVIGLGRSFMAGASATANATALSAADIANATADSTDAVSPAQAAAVRAVKAEAAELAEVAVDGTGEADGVASDRTAEAALPAAAHQDTPGSEGAKAEAEPATEQLVAPSAQPRPATVQFVSLRSSQLKGVGFPIDHAAVVWCFDLLQVLARGMQVLSRTNSSAPLLWAEAFPPHKRENTTGSTLALGSYEDHFQHRKQARANWDTAAQHERAYILTQLPWSQWMALPFDFLSRHLLKVAACYFLVCCLILAAPLLRTLTGNSASLCGGARCWDNMLPWNHLSVDITHALAFSAVKASVPPTLWRSIFTAFYQVLLVLFAVRAAYDYFFGTFDPAAYAAYLHWAVAYFAALLLRGALLVLVQSVQWVAGLGRALLRMTVWCKPIRSAVRRTVKGIDDACAGKLPFYASCTACAAPIAVLAVWAAVMVTAREHAARHHLSLDAVTFGLSVLTVVAYAAMCLGLAAALLAPTRPGAGKKSARTPSPYHVDLLLLYLPAPLVAVPAAHHALRLLYGTGTAYPAAAELFSHFHLDRILSILAMASIAAHVWAARLSSALPARVKALRWMYEVVGPQLLLDYTEVFGATYIESIAAADADSSDDADGAFPSANDMSGKVNSKGPKVCLHEDGGKFAVFEEVVVSDQGVENVKVADGVVLGSTYRVVSCDCARDKTLKDVSEWCAWCRCRKCGGKHLPPERGRFYTHASQEDASGLADFSSDLIPLLALPLVAYVGAVQLERSPYAYLYLLAAVAAAYTIREICHARGGQQSSK